MAFKHVDDDSSGLITEDEFVVGPFMNQFTILDIGMWNEYTGIFIVETNACQLSCADGSFVRSSGVVDRARQGGETWSADGPRIFETSRDCF